MSPGNQKSPSVTTAIQQPLPDTPTGVTKTLNLHNLHATLVGSAPQLNPALAQSFGQQIRPELFLPLHASRGGTPTHSPAHTPTPAAVPTPPLVTHKVTTVATSATGLPPTMDASMVTTTVPSSSIGAPLVARLVAGNQMVSVSNLLAAQRAQAQSPRTSTTIKIQGDRYIQHCRVSYVCKQLLPHNSVRQGEGYTTASVHTLCAGFWLCLAYEYQTCTGYGEGMRSI